MKELFVGEVALKVTISLAVCSQGFCLRQPLLVQLKFIDWQEVRRLRVQWETGPFLTIAFVTGCTKAFSQLSNLQSHSRCHQTDKPYKCNSCYKCFADEQSLFDHIPKHKESKHIKTHICSYCGKSYTQVCNIVTCMALWRTVYSQTEIRIGSKLYQLHGKECELNQAFFATF